MNCAAATASQHYHPSCLDAFPGLCSSCSPCCASSGRLSGAVVFVCLGREDRTVYLLDSVKLFPDNNIFDNCAMMEETNTWETGGLVVAALLVVVVRAVAAERG